MLRVVLDVNVFISALLTREGNPARVMREWAEGAFELVVSPQLLRELARVLAEGPVGRDMEPTIIADLEEALRADAVLVDDPPAQRYIAADPDDDYLVALALMAEAHVIVTGDRHLLEAELGTAAPRVLTPASFVALLEQIPER